VADSIISRVLAEDETDERMVLRELVVRKQKQSRYQDPLKLMRYLVGQGFSYDDVRAVLSHPEAD
jgi:SOS response regulatory protein OraA/RecX